MDIIYSNFSDQKNTISGSHNKEMFKLSNYLAQFYGYKTIFYGDEKSLKKFEDIKFNEVRKLEDPRIQEMPKELWSISKLFAMLQIDKPFIHIDQDLLLFKDFDQNYLQNNIVYFHDEYWVDKKTKAYQKFFKLDPSNDKYKDRSYNCAIIGGQNFNILKNICNEIIDFIINNLSSITATLNSKDSKKYDLFMPPVLVEQVWIFKLLKKYKQDFTPYLNSKNIKDISLEAYTKNICHLQGEKNSSIIKKTIIEMNRSLDI